MKKIKTIISKVKKVRRLIPIPMSAEERRERNGDKRVQQGYSSTGVPLPSHDFLVARHIEKEKRQKEHPSPRRSKAKMFIKVCMGGMNKQY